MLPATLQIPAAIILLAGGLVSCFAGYRLFRVVLSIYGFILGALLATSIVGAGSTGTLLIWAAVGGLAGAVILNLAYFLGVVLVGASIGAVLATVLFGRGGGDPHTLVVVLFAIAGAVAASTLQRYVIVAGTAFGARGRRWSARWRSSATRPPRKPRVSQRRGWCIPGSGPGRRWLPVRGWCWGSPACRAIEIRQVGREKEKEVIGRP